MTTTATPANREEVIDRAVKTALWSLREAEFVDLTPDDVMDHASLAVIETARRAVKAILEDLEDAGLIVVPLHETEAMLDAAIAAEAAGGDGDTWAAKLAASPYRKEA